MKKTLIIITSLLLICVMLIGCNSTDATIQASKQLNKNLNLLYNTVNRLDTVDNEYLVSNDIYDLNKINTNTVPSPNKTQTRVLAISNINEPQVNYTAIQENSDSLKNKNEKLTSTQELNAEEISLKDDLTQALKNELINRLYCDSNGNCKLCKKKYTCSDNGVCNSCNQTVICDSNGNCTSCKKTLILDNNNNCSSCKKSCVTTTPNTNLNSQTKSCLQKISANNQKLNVELLSTNNNDLVVKNNSDRVDTLSDINITTRDTNNNVFDNKRIDINNNSNYSDINSTQNNITDYDNINVKNTLDLPKEEINVTTDSTDTSNNLDNQIISDNKKPVEANDSNLDNTMNNETTNTDVVLNDNTDDKANNNTNTDNIVRFKPYKVIYYSESSFTPDLLKYNPRFINSINYDSANSTLNKYVEKLQKLYAMTADVVQANNTLANYKVVILDNIHDAKELNECILNGNCTPNANQVSALNNYIEDIKTTIKNLRNTNGTLTNEINKISSTNTGLAQSIDIANSNYLKILNQIDTRISYHENAIATLEQIKYLLQDAQNNNGVTIVEDLNNNTNITTDVNSSNNAPDNKVETVIDDKNIIVENKDNISPVTPNVDIKKEDSATTKNELIEIEKTIDENGNTVVEKKIITPDNSILADVEDDNNEIITKNDSSNDSTIVKETIVTENNDNLNSNKEFNNNSFLDKKSYSNVDTYSQGLGNVDTYKKKIVLKDETNQTQENSDNIKISDNIETNNNSDIVNNNDNLNTTNENTTNEVVSNDNDTIINPNNTPQMVDNTNNFGVAGNNYNNGLNNGYNNTIISQNNLDNNNLGNNSYRYDGNGTLYNNTNGYNNGSINNINERNNNVNTYKYNTLVDSINRGTVNNGINTLNVSA